MPDTRAPVERELSELTDEMVLAELREDERAWFNPNDPCLDHDYPNWSNGSVNDIVRRLALARIATRKAEQMAIHLSQCQACADGPPCDDEIAATMERIRARSEAHHG